MKLQSTGKILKWVFSCSKIPANRMIPSNRISGNINVCLEPFKFARESKNLKNSDTRKNCYCPKI